LNIFLLLSAHWCPPCRAFTPEAGKFYKTLQTSNPGALEVIFVSSDEDDESFGHYYAEQPWTSIPFSDETSRQELGQRFGVRGIPSFIVLNGETGDVVDKDGRSTVMSNKDAPAGALSKWA